MRQVIGRFRRWLAWQIMPPSPVDEHRICGDCRRCGEHAADCVHREPYLLRGPDFAETVADPQPKPRRKAAVSNLRRKSPAKRKTTSRKASPARKRR